MQPERAARLLAQLGAALLLLAVALRVYSLVQFTLFPPQSILNPEEQGRNLDLPAASPAYAQPFLGQYQFSPSGVQITFLEGVIPAGARSDADIQADPFWLDLASGTVTSGALPTPDPRPFLLRNGRLFLLVGEGYSLVPASPENSVVVPTSLSRSPDRTMLAFVAESDAANEQTLYVQAMSGRLDMLVTSFRVSEPDWSPDGESLAFAMSLPFEAETQIFRIERDGQGLRQLTSGPGNSSKPHWSPDGRSIAYLHSQPASNPQENASSAANLVDIFQVPAAGGPASPLTQERHDLFDLAWAGSARLLAYTGLSGRDTVEELTLLNPQTGQTRLAYPQITIDRLECPDSLAAGRPASARVTFSNLGPSAAVVQVVMRSGPQFIPPLDRPASQPLNTPPPNQPFAPPPTQPPTTRVSAAFREPYALASGQTRTVEWRLAAAPGRVTYLSARLDPRGRVPVVEQHCSIANTYLGLPKHPFLPSTLPLAGLGTLLCLPWLRRRRWQWWLVWALTLALLPALVFIESMVSSHAP